MNTRAVQVSSQTVFVASDDSMVLPLYLSRAHDGRDVSCTCAILPPAKAKMHFTARKNRTRLVQSCRVVAWQGPTCAKPQKTARRGTESLQPAQPEPSNLCFVERPRHEQHVAGFARIQLRVSCSSEFLRIQLRVSCERQGTSRRRVLRRSYRGLAPNRSLIFRKCLRSNRAGRHTLRSLPRAVASPLRSTRAGTRPFFPSAR